MEDVTFASAVREVLVPTDASSWPAVTYEQRSWVPSLHGPASRRALARHRGPYRAAVVPPIADATLDLPLGVLTEAEDASLELARFDAETGGEIAPFAAILLRSEAAASSQIEDLSASARAVAEAEVGAGERHNAREIVANVQAMLAAVALADDITPEAVLEMHRALMEPVVPGIAGRWRDEQVWIGGGSVGPHTADFVPPHHERVPAAIDDLVVFARRDDIPVLVHAAITHAQFEIVHPFPDGNGRTGRALLQSMLRNKRLTRNVTVPVSSGLLTDPAAYFDALQRYAAGDPRHIVERLSAASFFAVGNGRVLVDDLRTLRSAWRERLRVRRGAAAERVLDLALRQPVLTAAAVSEQLAIPPQNVYRAIEPLVAAQILVEFTDRRRNRAWRADEVLAALDAFAERAGRRRLP